MPDSEYITMLDGEQGRVSIQMQNLLDERKIMDRGNHLRREDARERVTPSRMKSPVSSKDRLVNVQCNLRTSRETSQWPTRPQPIGGHYFHFYEFLLLFVFVRTISYYWFVYVKLFYLQLFTIVAYHLNAHIMLLRYVICNYIWHMESQNYELLSHFLTFVYIYIVDRFEMLATYLVFNVVLTFSDIISDFITGINLIMKGDVKWGASTLLLTTLPFIGHLLVTCQISRKMKNGDKFNHFKKTMKTEGWQHLPMMQPFRQVFRYFLHFEVSSSCVWVESN